MSLSEDMHDLGCSIRPLLHAALLWFLIAFDSYWIIFSMLRSVILAVLGLMACAACGSNSPASSGTGGASGTAGTRGSAGASAGGSVGVGGGTGAAGASGVLFHSDWSAALGNSVSANWQDVVMDGGRWSGYIEGNRSGQAAVVSAAGFFSGGFSNALRVLVDGTAASPDINNLPIPAVGGSLFYRAYVYIDISDSEPTNSFSGNHPFEAGPGSVNWSFKWGHVSGSDAVDLHFAPYGGPNDLAVLNGTLHNRTEYRFELHVTLTAVDKFGAEIRIYDGTGKLLYNTDNFTFVNRAGHPKLTGATDLSAVSASWKLLAIGTNGPGWNFGAGPVYYYWGGVCVRDDTWCGPYANGV